MNKTNKNAYTQTTVKLLPEGKRGVREVGKGKRGQIYGDGERFDFG